jgi:predicted nucleic acid-binding protein
MTRDSWLIDNSALARIEQSPAATQWGERVHRGLVRIATPTLLEIGRSAQSANDLEVLLGGRPVSFMPLEYMTAASENRAVEVLKLLVPRGWHRAPKVPDLLIAAVAERAGLTVLHLDKDFELIAEVTGQPVERLEVED